MLHILSLGGTDAGWSGLKRWLAGEHPDLPAGCLLDVEVEARDVLAQFLPTGSQAALQTYRMLRDELGRRPLAAELFAQNILPKTVSQAAGSWFEFSQSEGDLSPVEAEVLKRYQQWLLTVETTNLNKSYKMVVLRVLLDHGDLFGSVDVNEFSQRCRRFMLQHPVLQQDLLDGKHALDHQAATDAQWSKWWREWPIDRWLDTQNGQRWFQLKQDAFQLAIACPDGLRTTLESMTEELVDWRLAAYSKSHRLIDVSDNHVAFEAKVSHAGGRPILFLPDQSKQPNRPVGPINVRLPDDSDWEFKFVKVACNVAKPVGGNTNELSSLLRQWFGKNAGMPGTDFKVLFELRSGQWIARPLDATPLTINPVAKESLASADGTVIEHTVPKRSEYRTHVPVYDLVAAAGGWGEDGAPERFGWIRIERRALSNGMFAARVEGQSMEPAIPGGSWCLFRPCPSGSRQGRFLLVQVSTHSDPQEGGRYTVKKYHSTKRINDDGWQHVVIELQPLNPDYAPIQIAADDASDVRIIGEFVEVIK